MRMKVTKLATGNLVAFPRCRPSATTTRARIAQFFPFDKSPPFDLVAARHSQLGKLNVSSPQCQQHFVFVFIARIFMPIGFTSISPASYLLKLTGTESYDTNTEPTLNKDSN